MQQICKRQNLKLDSDKGQGLSVRLWQLQIFSRSRCRRRRRRCHRIALTSSKGIYKIPFYQDTRRQRGNVADGSAKGGGGGGGNKFCVSVAKRDPGTVAGLPLDPMS